MNHTFGKLEISVGTMFSEISDGLSKGSHLTVPSLLLDNSSAITFALTVCLSLSRNLLSESHILRSIMM